MKLIPRDHLARLSAAALTLVLDAIVIWTAHANHRVPLTVLVALSTAGIAAAGVLRVSQLIPPAVIGFGGAFVALDVLGDIPRAVVVPYAFVLFLVAETAYEAVRIRTRFGLSRDRARLLYLGTTTLATWVVSVIVLGATAVLKLGIAAELVGLGAALGVLGAIGSLITRPKPRPALVPAETPGRRAQHQRRRGEAS